MFRKTCNCCGKTYSEVPLKYKTCEQGHAWFECDGEYRGEKCGSTLLVKNTVIKGVLGGKSHASELFRKQVLDVKG